MAKIQYYPKSERKRPLSSGVYEGPSLVLPSQPPHLSHEKWRGRATGSGSSRQVQTRRKQVLLGGFLTSPTRFLAAQIGSACGSARPPPAPREPNLRCVPTNILRIFKLDSETSPDNFRYANAYDMSPKGGPQLRW